MWPARRALFAPFLLPRPSACRHTDVYINTFIHNSGVIHGCSAAIQPLRTCRRNVEATRLCDMDLGFTQLNADSKIKLSVRRCEKFNVGYKGKSWTELRDSRLETWTNKRYSNLVYEVCMCLEQNATSELLMTHLSDPSKQGRSYEVVDRSLRGRSGGVERVEVWIKICTKLRRRAWP